MNYQTYTFLEVFIGYPGSVHDSRFLYYSPVFKEKLYPPGYFLLGDSGYPCSVEPIALIAPFKERSLNNDKQNFNIVFSAARNVIECAFGQMKLRWRSIFGRALRPNIENIVKLRQVILICLTYLTTPTSSASKYNEDENRPYEFRFKIENNQHRYEKRDENGIVMGEFGFVTADGRYHHTVYATDEEGSFKIVAMQNLNIEDIDDLYNIPRPASVPRFEIVPLKVLAPFSYNAVATTPKPNIPLIQAKPLDSKTCSNCKVPTTKPPIPITFAPIQRNTQKPFGVGLPEKLTTYRQLEITPKPIVSSVISEYATKSEPGNADDYYQVRAPEDQTQPIRKSSILPTQSTFTSSSLETHTGKLVNTVKDSIHHVSLQQSNIKQHSPENVQVIQSAGATKPSLGSIGGSLHPEDIQLVQSKPMIPPRFQSQSPVTAVPELSQTIQPPLLNNGPIEQLQTYTKPTTSAEYQFVGPVSPARESNQSLQPQRSPNLPVEQPPVNNQLSTPSQTQYEDPASPLRGSLQNVHSAENIPAEQPIISKQSSIFTQPQSVIQTSPIRGAISNLQPQTPQNLPVYTNPSSTIFAQPDVPASPIRDSIHLSQPQIKPVEQPLAYNKLTTPAQVQFERPGEPLSELQKLQPQQPHDILPIEQPSAFNRPSAPKQTQSIGPVSSVSGNLQSPHPQPSPNLAVDQPSIFNTPSSPIQIQSDDSSSPGRESLPITQSLLPQNGEVDQSLVYRDPIKPTLILSQTPANRETDSIQNVQPHISQNVPVEQPAILRKSATPLQAQSVSPLHPVHDSVQNIQPKISQFVQDEQPGVYKKPLISSQAPFAAPVQPFHDTVQNIKPQISQFVQDEESAVYKKPLISSQAQFAAPMQPVQDTVPNILPQISQHVAGEQKTVYKKPLTPSQAQFVAPVHPVQGTVQNIQSQISQYEKAEQPTEDIKPFTPSQAQYVAPVHPVPDTLQNIHPQISQHVAAEQPTVYKKPLTPSQGQFASPVHPVHGSTVENIQSQFPIQQPPVSGEQIGAIKYPSSYPASVTPQSAYPTLASPVETRSQSNVPTTSKMDTTFSYKPNEITQVGSVGDVNKYQYSTKNDNGEVLVVEPLSPAPDVRINLPKQLLVSSPRQIDLISRQPALPKLPQSLLTELKETMLKIKNTPSQSETAVPLKPISQFDREINIPKMEQILGNILYRFNYTAGYHGHHEQGDQGGNKEGGYHVITRDGYRRIVDYTANEDGYRPRIHIEFAQPQDVPEEETEKEKGLSGYEFKWFYLR